jgi:phasin family protein
MEMTMSHDAEKFAQAFKEQMEKLALTLKLPDLDVPALVESQRKTIEAISRAAQLSNETATEFSRRQLEIMRAGSEHLASMLKDMKLSAEQQRALATKSFGAASTSARELAEMTSKSNKEAFDQIKQRMADNFEEMRKSWKS